MGKSGSLHPWIQTLVAVLLTGIMTWQWYLSQIVREIELRQARAIAIREANDAEIFKAMLKLDSAIERMEQDHGEMLRRR